MRAVDRGEAELRAVAVGPFQVVRQGPVDIAGDGNSLRSSPGDRLKMLDDVGRTQDVRGIGDAVLGDDDGERGESPVDLLEKKIQPFGVDRPSRIGILGLGLDRQARAVDPFGAVVVHAEKIQAPARAFREAPIHQVGGEVGDEPAEEAVARIVGHVVGKTHHDSRVASVRPVV